MKIIPLQKPQQIYTCNSYLLLGDWNQLHDVNTLIDPGVDGHVLEEIEQLSTGCGKRGVEQVILTHEHFDHAAGAAEIKKRYGCRIYAFKARPEVDEVLHDGQRLQVGDQQMEVIHAPFHSIDSICLYFPQAGVLFSGDTPLRVLRAGGSYSQAYHDLLSRLARLGIDTVYSGHDLPLRASASDMIRRSLANVRISMIGADDGCHVDSFNPAAVSRGMETIRKTA